MKPFLYEGKLGFAKRGPQITYPGNIEKFVDYNHFIAENGNPGSFTTLPL